MDAFFSVLPCPFQKGPDKDEEDLFGEEDGGEEFYREAAVRVDGLDRIHKHRGINQCIDLSATPCYLGRVGQNANRPFPWVVSDFGLIDAIESGLVKIPRVPADSPGTGPRSSWVSPRESGLPCHPWGPWWEASEPHIAARRRRRRNGLSTVTLSPHVTQVPAHLLDAPARKRTVIVWMS